MSNIPLISQKLIFTHRGWQVRAPQIHKNWTYDEYPTCYFLQKWGRFYDKSSSKCPAALHSQRGLDKCSSFRLLLRRNDSLHHPTNEKLLLSGDTVKWTKSGQNHACHGMGLLKSCTVVLVLECGGWGMHSLFCTFCRVGCHLKTHLSVIFVSDWS